MSIVMWVGVGVRTESEGADTSRGPDGAAGHNIGFLDTRSSIQNEGGTSRNRVHMTLVMRTGVKC
jgi:hypothetical protein